MGDPRISGATRAAEARARGQAERMPAEGEERRADQRELDPDVARQARDAAVRGARQKGEGRIEG